jgi:1,4-dihydroxy-6-naphthoate synthase
MTYDAIMPAVAEGRSDAGLSIHESRFTYPEYGLTRIVDLGEWWEKETGAPIPLGAIVVRRDLVEQLPTIEGSIRRSVEYAFSNPEASARYVRAHAQEMSDAVMLSHIDLYVNEYSIDLGTEGEEAVRELIRRAAEAGLLSTAARDPFAGYASIQK